MSRLYESQLFKSKVPFWRVWAFLLVATGLFICIIVRAIYVQLINSDFYIYQGEQRHTRNLTITAPRGNLLDRNGNILAESIEASSIAINPLHYWQRVAKVKSEDRAEFIQQNNKKIAELAKILNLPASEVNKKFNMQNRAWLELKKVVQLKDVEKIRQLGLTGLEFSKVYYRQYALGEAAAHILGVTNVDGEGQEGLELLYDKVLIAKPGKRKVLKDSHGKIIDEFKDYAKEAVRGDNISLTIDKTIQSYSYKILKEAVLNNKAQSGSMVILDAQSGDILALTNYPSYEPNNRGSFVLSNMRNRAVTDKFEPGSTMKPFSIAAALDAKIVNPQTVIKTDWGRTKLFGRTITDISKNESLNIEQIIEKSSNIGTAKVVSKLQPQYLWSKYNAVGFGIKPKLELPGVVSGSLRDYRAWRPIEQATMGYGYGISVTLLQLAKAYTVFANNGYLLDVNIVKKDKPKPSKAAVYSATTVQNINHMLHLVTTNGGGKRAQTADYLVGGKSGTAQKIINGRYSNSQHRSWFAGIAPISNPRIVVAIMIDNPTANGYYGGLVAAPIFGEITQQTLHYLRVKPDKEDSQLVALGEGTNG